MLKHDLEGVLRSRALEIDDRAYLDEALWLVALAAAGRAGRVSYEPVPIADVEDAVMTLDPTLPTNVGDRLVPTQPLLDRMLLLRDEGATEVRSPWPEPDAELASGGGWIWDPYTPEQQRRRVEAVYTAALRCYAAIITRWFPRLGNRMLTSVTLPAVLSGYFSPGKSLRRGGRLVDHDQWPTMVWHLEPLPAGEASVTRISVAAEGEMPRRSDDDWRREMEARQSELVALRPEAAAWITTVETHSVADVFQQAPMASILYDWLKSDLRRVEWA
jgi:hypothetical protein